MPTLREISRQEYLQKRERQKLDDLRDAVLDEEYLFAGVKMSAKEEAELKYKKKVLALAEERAKNTDDVVEYRMPTAYDKEGEVKQDQRYAVALARYK